MYRPFLVPLIVLFSWHCCHVIAVVELDFLARRAPFVNVAFAPSAAFWLVFA